MRAIVLGFGYKCVRRLAIVLAKTRCRLTLRPFDLESVVEWGDGVFALLYKRMRWPLFKYSIASQNTVKVHGLVFPSPLIAAAFKSDVNMLGAWLDMGLGGVTLKTVMPHSRDGNPRPRMREVRIDAQPGVVNALGLPGSGISAFCDALPHLPVWKFNRPIGISVGGDSVDDYIAGVQQIDAVLKTKREHYYFEINISCPNTPEGKKLTAHFDLFSAMVAGVRGATDAPIAIKFSPDQATGDILRMVTEVKRYNKMLVTLGNTQFCSREKMDVSPQEFSMPGGGLSGPALFNRTLELTGLIAPLGVPVIATGGITTPDDVMAVLSAGASLVGMATVLVTNPYQIPRMNYKISRQR
ncbi:MAG: nitronate monooxygenase [bacterium]|nr:nitronate monooxygenase [bacterium]